ncbi:hypothetical protein DFH09DRAFT_1333951 [Mycena vulgaris]|nr:hypothetical protein DFH09DRAFT_1333951 [Mycena vulgaris]
MSEFIICSSKHPRTLVVVFPAAHKGGALTLSPGCNTWSFDSAAEFSVDAPGSGAAYDTFYSDLTPAVEPVLEGHRITLTYKIAPAPLASASLPARSTSSRTFCASCWLISGGRLPSLRARAPVSMLPLATRPGRTASDSQIGRCVGLETHVKILGNEARIYMKFDSEGGATDIINHVTGSS